MSVDEWDVLAVFDEAVNYLGIETAKTGSWVWVYRCSKESSWASDLCFDFAPVLIQKADETVSPSMEYVVHFC